MQRRIPSLWLTGAALVISLFIGISCDSGPSNDQFGFHDLGKPVIGQFTTDASNQLVTVRTIGAGTGNMAFSRIGPTAVDDTLMAIVSPAECQIVLLNALSMSVIRRIGRCGGGPGEFEAIGSIALISDSLVVWDNAVKKLIVLDLQGGEARRLSPELNDGDPSISALATLNDSTLLLVHDMPNKAAPRDMIVAVSKSDGRKLLSFLASPTIFTTNARNITMGVALCASPSGDVAVMNHWKYEVATFRQNGKARAHTITNISWQKNEELLPKEWMPSGLAHIACGDNFYAAKYSTIVRAADGSYEEGNGHLEIRTYDGELLYSSDEAPVTLFKGRVAAVRGSHVFMANNNAEAFPVMVEYALREQAK